MISRREPDRKLLIELIQARLIPQFEQRGFLLVPLTREEKGSEVGASFPFGRLRRQHASGFDLVELQLNKHKALSLRVNLGKVPAEGIRHVVGPVKAEDVWVHFLGHYCELYGSRALLRWFSPRQALLRPPDERSISDLVDRLVGLVPEIDAYFSTGRLNRHLRCV